MSRHPSADHDVPPATRSRRCRKNAFGENNKETRCTAGFSGDAQRAGKLLYRSIKSPSLASPPGLHEPRLVSMEPKRTVTSLYRQPPQPHSRHHRVSPIRGPELVHDPRQVVLGRSFTDAEATGDQLVRVALGHQREDLSLSVMGSARPTRDSGSLVLIMMPPFTRITLRAELSPSTIEVGSCCTAVTKCRLLQSILIFAVGL